MLLMQHAVTVSVLAGILGLCQGIQRVKLGPGMTWANKAWGFSDSGNDSIKGMKMVLVDPEDMEADDIERLKGDNHIVMCYFSAGTIEKFRKDYEPYKERWDALAMGEMSQWDETWLDIRQPDSLLELMDTRLQRFKDLGCQAVEPDNMDCFDNEDCYSTMEEVSESERKELEIAYVRRLADMAHSYGLAIVVKNALDIVADIHTSFDGVITENCLKYDECEHFKEYFYRKGKAFFAVEYRQRKRDCTKAGREVQMKYCAANKGNYLCKSKARQWKECFPKSAKLPPTEYIVGDVDSGTGNAPIIQLPCASQDTETIVSTKRRRRFSDGFKTVPKGSTLCYVIGASPGTNKLILKPILKRGDSLKVYQIKQTKTIDSELYATSPIKLRAFTGRRRASAQSFRTDPNHLFLVVLETATSRSKGFKAKHWSKL
mmetsp:Transcript_31192/g.50048  ORF Transcript_31192/g.50048 Transcript_31192/m.50048 type:complete len:431 (+) Transcript_31192:171-1463(+)